MKLSPHWPSQHTKLGILWSGLNINLCHSRATADSQAHSRVFCGEFGTNLVKYFKPEGFYYCKPAGLWWPICSHIQIELTEFHQGKVIQEISLFLHLCVAGLSGPVDWHWLWGIADRGCSNYIWVISNLIPYKGATYIRGLTMFCKLWLWHSVLSHTWVRYPGFSGHGVKCPILTTVVPGFSDDLIGCTIRSKWGSFGDLYLARKNRLCVWNKLFLAEIKFSQRRTRPVKSLWWQIVHMQESTNEWKNLTFFK